MDSSSRAVASGLLVVHAVDERKRVVLKTEQSSWADSTAMAGMRLGECCFNARIF
jgi:hypothetical protein